MRRRPIGLFSLAPEGALRPRPTQPSSSLAGQKRAPGAHAKMDTPPSAKAPARFRARQNVEAAPLKGERRSVTRPTARPQLSSPP
jgi:hypothetical protein